MLFRTRKMPVLLAVATVCLVLLFVGSLGPDYPRSWYHIWDLGHLLSFALWTWLYLRWKPLPRFWTQLLLVLGLFFLLGGATELLQAALGRTASWTDLAKDLLGCLLAVVFCSPARNSLPKWQRTSLQLLVLMLVAWSLLPMARVVADELIARQQFPLLSGFEISTEADRWGGGSRQVLDPHVAKSGAASLRVELSTQPYAGVGLLHFPSDWRGYRLVRLHLFNPEPEPLLLHFRIHDQLHRLQGNAYSDRFNTSFTLPGGWSKIDVPLQQVQEGPKNRDMQMARIAGMLLFVVKLEQPRSFNIDEVLLVR